MTDVRIARMGELCQVGDGTHSKIPRQESGVLYLTSRNFKDGALDLSSIYYISEEDFEKHFEGNGKALAEPEYGDLVFSIIGTIGEPYLVKRSDKFGLSSSVAIVRPDKAVLDPTFLFYWLKGPTFQQALFGIKGGVAQGYVSLEMIRSLPVPQMPVPVQRRIAYILSAYDDLIENNERRIKILEEMARSLYREWFVNFRFPGHEKVPLVLSPFGDIPKGWEGRFGDLATIDRDGISPFEYPGEQFVHYSIPAFDNGREPPIELGETILSGKYCIDDSSVLLSKLNPRIPRVWLPVLSAQHRAITSTEFLVLKPRPYVTREFIYAKCSSEEFSAHFGSLAIGTSTSHQRVKPENLLAMPSAVPDRKTIDRFTKLVSPMLVMSQQIRVKIQNLRRTRDLLLPRLLSGHVKLPGTAAAV